MPTAEGNLAAVDNRLRRRWTPLLVVAAVLAIAFLAMARLPESYVAQLARSRPLGRDQADWAYRLLAFAAFAQAVYGGFVLLHSDRIHELRTNDERVAAMSRERVLALVIRNAAVTIFLTFVYGIAAFFITGQRGGFWLFALLTVLQGAWYFRQVNVVARFLEFQRDPEPPRPSGAWREPPQDYTPPIVRGLQPTPSGDPSH
ncbi:MAG: DUF3329 domain-containing protein [Actinomycetota bacterium]|nr:DUF3329 domain-containing protein [Actinomycetota bacterium]